MYRTLTLVLSVNFAFLLGVVFRMSFTCIICDFLFVYIFLGICINYLADSLGYSIPIISVGRRASMPRMRRTVTSTST